MEQIICIWKNVYYLNLNSFLRIPHGMLKSVRFALLTLLAEQLEPNDAMLLVLMILWCLDPKDDATLHWRPCVAAAPVLHNQHGKVEDTWYSAFLWTNPITETLEYVIRCQGITQLDLPPTRLSTNWLNHSFLCLPSQSWSSFTHPERRKAELVQAQPRWVNSLPLTATWQISQMFAVQTGTPHMG